MICLARSGVRPITEITMSTLSVSRIGNAVGAGDLLQLDLHAERLADHLGEVDVEAFGLALCVLRAERRHVERHGDAHHAVLDDVGEGIGARLACGEAKCAEPQ